MKRSSRDTALRAGARALLAAAGTVAAVRIAFHFRRALMLMALAAASDLLVGTGEPGRRSASWWHALRAAR